MGVSESRWLQSRAPSLVDAGVADCGAHWGRRDGCSWKRRLGEGNGGGGRNGKHELRSGCASEHIGDGVRIIVNVEERR